MNGRGRGGPGSAGRAATGIFLLLLAAGAALRLADLGNRPLHGDEAVGAFLSQQVKDSGSLIYQYSNRHGPFQYLLGGAAMALGGESAFWIRIPYALVGCLLPLCLLPLRRRLGDPGWILAAGLAAFSPMFVYYSRYAIQEIELAVALALLLACGAAFAAGRGGLSLAGALAAAGWLATIKETFIIIWGCAAMALALGAVLGGKRFRDALRAALDACSRRPRALVAGLAAGALLPLLAYTDLFRHAEGLAHLIRNLEQMLSAGASSAGAVALHTHPASFYLRLLLRYEWPILALALLGGWAAWRSRRPLALFLALLALLTGGVYFLLPYKTPWLLLTPLVPLVLLAGFGGGAWMESPRGPKSPRARLAAALLVSLLPLPRTVPLSFVHPADPVAEPLVYHQAGREQEDLAREIRRLLAPLPAGTAPRALVCLPYLWPLAWYLRDERGVLYERRAIPSEAPEALARIPVVVTLEGGDPTFLKVFIKSSTVPPFTLPGHVSRTYVLVPPAYAVARLWIRSDLAGGEAARGGPPRRD